jgi:CelD/BcsL family acetyltransferase involved in cellulose biosynthesis
MSPPAAGLAGPAIGHRAADRAPVYQAELLDSLDAFCQRCSALADAQALPFHHPLWLRTWYDTLGRTEGRQPVLLAIRRRDHAGDVMLLPLVASQQTGLRWLDYADGGVVDYVMPLVAPDWAAGADEQVAAAALWRAARQALGEHDVLRLDKLLPRALVESGRGANPLVLALPTLPSELFGNQFEVRGDWEVWRRSLDKRVRKEIERCWRVFHRSPDARFECITDPLRAARLLSTLEQQQSARLTPVLGARYRLDQPAYRDFYRQLLAGGLADGSVVLTALLDGDQVVSAMFGVANRSRYIGLRQSLGGDAWKRCSPGRLLDEQTARHLHGQGHVHFDFGVGQYFHKTTLQMAQIPLVQVCVALSWRGKLAAMAWRTKCRLKQQPKVMAAWRQMQALFSRQPSPAGRPSEPPHP